MNNAISKYEEQMHFILSITKATRAEVIKTLTLSQISLQEIVDCLKMKTVHQAG